MNKQQHTLDPIIISTEVLINQKFGIFQDGILLVSPAVFSLMAEEDDTARHDLSKNLIIVNSRPSNGAEEIFQIAYDAMGVKLKMQTDVVYQTTMSTTNNNEYPVRTVRIVDTENQIDLLEHQVNIGTPPDQQWVRLHSEFISEDMIFQFYFTIGNEMMNERVYNKRSRS